MELSPWSSLLVGHFNAKRTLLPRYILSSAKFVFDDLTVDDCVTVIYPNLTWLQVHGWGVSDARCTDAFQTLSGSNTPKPPPGILAPAVVFLDGMFNEAHIAEALVTSPARFLRGSRGWLERIYQGYNIPGANRDFQWAANATEDTVAVVFPTNTSLGVHSPSTDRSWLADLERLRRYTQVSSGCGTQYRQGCIVPCQFDNIERKQHCGVCEVFKVRAATFTTVAAVPDGLYAFYSEESERDVQLLPATVEAPLLKLVEYITTFGNSSSKGEGQHVPWCLEGGDKHPYVFKTSHLISI
jgi:hypothetical protein